MYCMVWYVCVCMCMYVCMCVCVYVCMCVCVYVCICMTKLRVKDGVCESDVSARQCRCEFVPHLPRKTTVDVSLCHTCHAKCHGVTGDQIRPSAPPTAISATPAAQNDGRCEFVPRLPRKTAVDVSLCHTCHAKCLRCEFVPRLPRKTMVDVSLCHACDAKCRGVTGDQIRPSAPPTAISATAATQNDGKYEFEPHLPRKVPQM